MPCECVGTLAVTSLILLLGNRRMLLPGTKYSEQVIFALYNEISTATVISIAMND